MKMKISVKFLIYLMETEYSTTVCELFKHQGISTHPHLVKMALQQLEADGIEYIEEGFNFDFRLEKK